MSTFRHPLVLCGLALGLGLWADLLFYDHALGLSVLLFVAPLLAANAALAQAEGKASTPANRWLAIAALCFAALVAVRANPLLIMLNTLAACCLLLLYATLYGGMLKVVQKGARYPTLESVQALKQKDDHDSQPQGYRARPGRSSRPRHLS